MRTSDRENSSSINIGLLWHSVNSDNLGVGALTESHIAIIEEISTRLNTDVQFRIFGWQDTRAAYIKGSNVKAVGIRYRQLWYPSAVHREISDCDLVIDISAGDSFTDIYGRFRIVSNLLGKAAVFLCRKPLVLGPQTIGPFSTVWAKPFAFQAMKWASLVTTRDRLSSDVIAPLRLGDKAIEATDVAMRLPYRPNDLPDTGKPKVGLNVSGLLYNGGYSGRNMFDLKADYGDVVRRLLNELSDAGAETHLIGHVNSAHIAVEDDYRVCEALAEEFPDTALAPRFETPSDAKSYISGLEFFAGARMHACIAAFSSGVPVVPMAYSRKFEGLFGTLGYHRVTDCRTEPADTIVAAVMAGFRDRAALKTEVESSFAKADAKLSVYEDRLEGLIRERVRV